VAILGRIFGLAVGLLMLGAGALGLGLAYVPEAGWLAAADPVLVSLGQALGTIGKGFEAEQAHRFLSDPVLRFALPGLGLFLLASSLWRRGEAKTSTPSTGGPDVGPPVLDRGAKKHFEKEARLLVKRGQLAEAAEVYRDAGELDKAVTILEEGEQFQRAAEIRREQGDLEACADLYLRADRTDLAARAFSDAGAFEKAARCYRDREQHGLAGEMFEQAGLWKLAGDSYGKIEFHRQAAKAYIKARSWVLAAASLEAVIQEEFARVSDPSKRKERRQLVLQAAKLYQEAGDLDEAQRVLEKGECFGHAGQLAMEREQYEQAAELFFRAEDAERGAEALRRLGRDVEAARVLGEHYRDRGRDEEAAALLMEAGETEQAGELYRKLEEFLRAGECFEAAGDHRTAAEMYRAAGDPTRAAVGYEGAGFFADAAACWAEIGDDARRAEALEQAGRHLESGRIYQELGRDEDAVRVLQKIDVQHPDYRASSAILGAFFHGKKMYAVAIKKLRQACEGQDLSPESAPLFYHLARCYEDHGEVKQAVDLYERILAFDIQWEDVSRRLETVRKRLQIEGEKDTAGGGTRRKDDQRYRIVGELGRGGMGIVYKALDTVLDREVAYKVLPETLKQNAKALENFLREAKSAAQLNHPNIVTVYDAGEQGGQYYIAMEYVDGTTLKDIVKRKGVIKPRGVLHVLAQMCEALEFAHAKGIVHRDIKSANTMWTRDKKAKIMDFGLAKAIEEVRNQTTMVSGTPFYMSPEQTLGKNIDHRTDIYSLGVSIFEMSTGRVPFREGNVPYHHVHTPPPDPCEVNPKLPPLLGRIISRCLKKDPAERYQTAGEILAEVKAALTRRDEGAAKA
jgi:tetratricopeptide (TPR) repeat protein